MPPSSPGDLSASMAILGLVVQQPGTGASVAVRLSERFPRAGWSRNVVHNNVPSLEKQGLLRVVRRDPSDKVSLNLYEATDEGVARLREWIRESAMVPPVLRDELQGKLKFSALEDLRVLVQEVAAEETACAGEYARAHTRDQQARQLRRRRETRSGPADLDVLTKEIQMTDEAVVWGQRAKRLQGLREHIEDVLEAIEDAEGSSASDDE